MADILLVEDKDSLRRVLRLTLENAGYSVTEAVDASSALNEIATTRHRLVLTDFLQKPVDSNHLLGVSYKTLLNKMKEYAL